MRCQAISGQVATVVCIFSFSMMCPMFVSSYPIARRVVYSRHLASIRQNASFTMGCPNSQGRASNAEFLSSHIGLGNIWKLQKTKLFSTLRYDAGCMELICC